MIDAVFPDTLPEIYSALRISAISTARAAS